jgi:hypothetical protein
MAAAQTVPAQTATQPNGAPAYVAPFMMWNPNNGSPCWVGNSGCPGLGGGGSGGAVTASSGAFASGSFVDIVNAELTKVGQLGVGVYPIDPTTGQPINPNNPTPVAGPTAAGSAAANPPEVFGGTVGGSPTGIITDVWVDTSGRVHVVLEPGASFIGQTGGQDTDVANTPTIQSAAYASGNCMGGFQALAVARISGGSGVLNFIDLISSGGGTTALQVYVFNANPTSSTCTDKSTFSIATADQTKLLTTFSLTPAAVTGSSLTEAEQTVMAKSFTTSGNTNLYIAIVSGGTWTPASTTDLKVVIGASLN